MNYEHIIGAVIALGSIMLLWALVAELDKLIHAVKSQENNQ